MAAGWCVMRRAERVCIQEMGGGIVRERAMKARAKVWADKVKEEGKGRKQGPPHLPAWEGLLEALLEDSSDIGANNKNNCCS